MSDGFVGQVEAVLPIEDVQTSSQGRSSALAQFGLTPWDALSFAITLLLVVAFAPPLLFDGWTARMGIVLAAGPLGLLCLAALARQRDRPAIVLLGALGWTVIVSLSSGAARSALLGTVGRDLSALVVIASCAIWALGRRMSLHGRQLLPAVFVGACSFNALLGVLQLLGDVQRGSLALYFGRSTGLSINPVYFGALSAAAVGVSLDRWTLVGWRRWTGSVLVLGLAVTFSGSRVALLAAVGVIAVRLATRRNRDTVLGSGLAVVSLALGVVLDRVRGSGVNAADRLADAADGGEGGRTQVWRYALDGFADRPVFGYGFGRFRPAVQSRFSVDFVRVSAPDDLSQAWFDAHNVLIALLVAVGVVGAGLFIAWAGSWSLRVRGPLAWALLAICFHWLLQPVSLVTLPLMMLLFGAAGSERSEPYPLARRSIGACLIVGGLLGAAVVTADAGLQRAVTRSDPDLAENVALVYLRDPIVSDVVAQIVRADADEAVPTDGEMVWHRRAADAEPDRPYWWVMLARAQINRGDVDEAEVSVAQALELQPTNVRALQAEAIIAIERDDEARLEAAFDLLCALGQPECELDPMQVLQSASS